MSCYNNEKSKYKKEENGVKRRVGLKREKNKIKRDKKKKKPALTMNIAI